MTNLPIPIPASEVPGNFITGALWNANVYNGLTFLLNPPVFIGYQANSQSIPYQAWTALSIDSTTVDTYGGHSNSTNNTRYTAQVAGWYTACGVACLSQNSTGARGARLQLNGNPVQGAGQFVGSPANTNASALATPTRDIYMNVGDYLEVASWQSGASPLATAIFIDVTSALYVRFSHV